MDRYDPHGGRAYAHRRADAITAEFMDIGIGTEGGREITRLPVVEGEYDREESPRRVWDDASPPNFGYPEGKGQTYQLTSEQYAKNEVEQYVRKVGAANHSGGANWVFSDSTSGGRVASEVARASGEVDGVRLPKEAYYVCSVMFRADPQVHIIGHGTYPANTKKTIYVAANGDDVELFVNGKSLGHAKPTNHYLFTFPDVAWEPGEIKAVTYIQGKVVATQIKHTIGAPVGLKITPIVGPGGLKADGSDIALFDVEAVDAKGERCPTFQQRVDFEVEGPATWRGGYNSGKIKSINNTYLDLEAGINRVSVRAGRTAGAITLSAKAEGLKPASAIVQSTAFPVENGYTSALPAMPRVSLGKSGARAPGDKITAGPVSTAKGDNSVGQYTKTFMYTGPTNIVHVETHAQDAKNIYVDRDYIFEKLPTDLVGADWVQMGDADARYSAVDLIQMEVKGGSVVTIAHDERVSLPSWLTSQFKSTDQSITIHGKPMKLFQRRVDHDESFTFGSNTEESKPKASNMYVVFVSAAR